jgi:antitoxin (DNA-binding transcriptional repressor) of toxin-antitoxin stability system
MQTVSIRTFTHNFSKYLKEVKAGECITILERNNPVMDVIPHNEHVMHPRWKRHIEKRVIRGEAFSNTVKKLRDGN